MLAKFKTVAGILLTLLSMLAVATSFGIYLAFALDNLVFNGGFETGTMEGWLRDPASPGGDVAVQSSIVHSGSYAMKIDTRNASTGDFVYQNVSLPRASFEFESWVYKVSGDGHWVELVRKDWDVGTTYVVTAVVFRENTVEFITWKEPPAPHERLNISYTLSPGVWHNVTVKANATLMKQELFIDGLLITEQNSTLTFLPEWIIFGDVAAVANQGLFYYDDFHLTSVCDIEITSVVSSVTEGYPTWSPCPKMNINVTVDNVGGLTTNVTVNAYYDNDSAWVLIGSQIQPALTGNVTLTFNWDLAGVPLHHRTIKANATAACTDTDEYVDDQVIVKLPGDIVYDRVVDSTDLGTMGVAWPPGIYNLQCDFNNCDGVIDSTDLGILGANWGVSY